MHNLQTKFFIQCYCGIARKKIITNNDIGAGTISIIVDDYKTGLDNLDLDSFRQLTIEAKKRGISSNDLASFFRLYNFFPGSHPDCCIAGSHKLEYLKLAMGYSLFSISN